MTVKSQNILVALLLFLLTYPLFYYAYKFGNPDFGTVDFYNYYPAYKDLNFKVVKSPFNIRIISPFLVYLFYKTGIFYNAEISFFREGYDQRVFFSAIAVNYIFFVATLLTVFHLIKKYVTSSVNAFLFALVYGYSFATLFYTLNTLTESVSTFLFAIAFFFYLQRSAWVILILFLLIFQREYILMAFGLIALADYFLLGKESKSFFLKVFISSVLFFFTYLILRKTVFYTPHHEGQLQFDKYLGRLLNPNFHFGEYVRQSFLNQNIFLVYLLVIIYKLVTRIKLVDTRWLVINILLYIQVNLISVFAVLGNNTGRYFSTLLPLTFYALVKEVHNLINRNEPIQDSKA